MAQPSSEILARLTDHPVLIVGAGVSGLAAGISLVRRGIKPLILEQKPAPGGRSSSFHDATSGETVDNGQHVLIAGYTRTMAFLEAIGTSHLLAIQPRPDLLFHHPSRGFRRFSVPRMVSPFHLGAAITFSRLLPPVDRLRMLKAGLSIALNNPASGDGTTVADWLAAHGQSRETRRSFWDPLAVSIMNELPDRASAGPFLRSLREAFLGSWHNGALALPKVPLTVLYAAKAVELLQAQGAEVVCGQDVRGLTLDEGAVTGIVLRDGTPVPCRALILTVPPHRLAELLPSAQTTGINPDHLRQFTYVPIVSTHLWFGSEFMPFHFMGLIGRSVQWVFNRRRIEDSTKADSHLSTVTSAAHDLVDKPNDAIIGTVLDDLKSVFGSAVSKPRHAVVVKEKRATVSLTPASEKLRPSQKTAIPNLFIAGDWTSTGYPATIEGAVISGERSADLAAGFLRTKSAGD